MRRVVVIKHVQIINGSDGKPRYAYFRRGKDRQRIKAALGTAEFEIEVDEIRRGLRTADAPAVGTLGHAIGLYRSAKNPAWEALRPATKLSYQRAFDTLKVYDDVKLSQITRATILKLRDQDVLPERGRWMANYCVTVIGIVLQAAVDRGDLAINPLSERVRKIRRPRGRRQNRAWTLAERTVVLERAAPHVRLVLALFMCSGLRRADALTATMSMISGNEIAVRTAKRDTPVRLPIHPLLADALRHRPVAKRDKPQGVQIALRKDGQPWTLSGFDSVWQRYRVSLEKEGLVEPGLTLHGLRHTLSTILREAGVDAETRKMVVGHANTAQTEEYSREAGLPDDVKAKVVSLRITESGTKL